MKIFKETMADVKRLSEFQDQTFVILDGYSKHYVSPKGYTGLLELKKDLLKLKEELRFESANIELAVTQLERFQQLVWVTLRRYIDRYVPLEERPVYSKLERELWDLKIDLWDQQHAPADVERYNTNWQKNERTKTKETGSPG